MVASRHWADWVAPDVPEPIPDDDPYGREIDRPGTTWLALTGDPLVRSMFRPRLDPGTGETFYDHRPYYDLDTDRSPLDDVGGRIFIGDQAGDSTVGPGGSNRCPEAPSAGQWLQSNRIGSVKRSPEEGEPESEKAKVNGKDRAAGVVYVRSRRGSGDATAPFRDPEAARRMWAEIARSAREETRSERRA